MSASVTSLYPRRWWALAVLVAGQFMFVADAFIVNVAIPSIKADLGASSSEIEAVVAIYQIAYAALLITGGRLGDIHGRKRWFIIGVLGFTAASAWCAIAGSPLMLIAARGAQGITAAFMVPQVLASIQTMFPSEERTRAFGVVGLALGLGGAAGLMLGGWLISLDVHGLGWRSAFIINIPVGLLVAASALPLVPEPHTASRTRLDVPGVLVLAIGLALVLGPALFGRDMGWPWWIWPTVGFGALLLAAFLRLEAAIARRKGEPLIDPAILSHKPFAFGLAATFSFYLGFTSFLLVLTLLLQDGLGHSALETGLASAPLALAFLIASRLAVGLTRLDRIATIKAGSGILAISQVALMALVWEMPKPTLLMLATPLAVYGFGQGFVMSPLLNEVLAKARHAPAGAVSGVLITVQQISGAFGIALVGTAYFAAVNHYPAAADRAGFLVSMFAQLAMAGTAYLCLRQMASTGESNLSVVRQQMETGT
jgi:EmrB/QacA subfamily drug resistance transporter